jgi:ferrous iron transport protein A
MIHYSHQIHSMILDHRFIIFVTPQNYLEYSVEKKTFSRLKASHLKLEDVMFHQYIPLSTLPIGQKAQVKMLTSDGTTRRRMLDLGLIIDTVVEALLKSPAGDPVAYHIRGAVIALRSEEAGKILVQLS